jgi:hypothetical protein
MPGTKFIIAITALLIVMNLEVVVLFLLLGFAIFKSDVSWFQALLKGAFLFGLCTALVAVGVLRTSPSLGIDPSIMVVFCALLIETSILGLIAFRPPWRFLSLLLLLIGILLLRVVYLNRR